MKISYYLPVLLLAATVDRAQLRPGADPATRYSTQGHLPIETQPAPGYELPDYLGQSDSVQVLTQAPGKVPTSISAAMRRQFVYVRYPSYRGQPAGQGWVLRRGLVSTLDSSLRYLPPVVGQEVTTTKTVTTKTVTTRIYRPVPAARPAPRPKAVARP